MLIISIGIPSNQFFFLQLFLHLLKVLQWQNVIDFKHDTHTLKAVVMTVCYLGGNKCIFMVL